MSVYQVEQYYIFIKKQFTEEEVLAIEKLLEDSGFSNYEFADHGLVVDDFESESEGVALEAEIEELIN